MEEIKQIHEFSEFAQIELSILWAIVVSLGSIAFFSFLQIYSINKPKKFKDIQVKKWWFDNQVMFVMSFFLCILFFSVSSLGGAVTGERALLIWPTVQYVLKLLLGLVNGNSERHI